MELRGASALVTGAGRGIGRAIALALGRAGASVTGVARTASELESLASEIQRAGGRATSYAGDVRDPAVCAGAIARAREAHGRLQILVNNAGVGAHAPVAETTDEQWQRILDTNLTAGFRLAPPAVRDPPGGGGGLAGVPALPGSQRTRSCRRRRLLHADVAAADVDLPDLRRCGRRGVVREGLPRHPVPHQRRRGPPRPAHPR